LGDQLLELLIATDESGLRKLVLQIAHQRVRVIVQEDGADASLALRNQSGAE
jgi:hypothetical protein